MPNLLVAGNSTNGGTAISTDTSGTLNIVTGSGSGANAITIDASQNVTMAGTLAVTGAQTIGGNLTVTGSITGGSISVANSLRAWVNFNGSGTVAIRASGNVSSITDNGVGNFTINFTTAISDVNYSVSGVTSVVGGGANGFTTTTFSTGSIQIQCWGFSGAVIVSVDPTYVTGSIFR